MLGVDPTVVRSLPVSGSEINTRIHALNILESSRWLQRRPSACTRRASAAGRLVSIAD